MSAAAVAPSLLKWVGSKRWLAGELTARILSELRGTYYEPFLGSAAIYLQLRACGHRGPSVLSDILAPLVETYRWLVKYPEDVAYALEKIAAEAEPKGQEGYLAVREAFNDCLRPKGLNWFTLEQAARFIYLNRHSFNGLWRQNKQGLLNSPWGGKGRCLPNRETLLTAAAALGRAHLQTCDFAETIKEAKAGDVVYADPPYDGVYTGYAGGFSWGDQERLCGALLAAYHRGATIFASNSDTPEIRSIYRAPFTFERLEVAYRVGGKGERRKPGHELLITAISGGAA